MPDTQSTAGAQTASAAPGPLSGALTDGGGPPPPPADDAPDPPTMQQEADAADAEVEAELGEAHPHATLVQAFNAELAAAAGDEAKLRGLDGTLADLGGIVVAELGLLAPPAPAKK